MTSTTKSRLAKSKIESRADGKSPSSPSRAEYRNCGLVSVPARLPFCVTGTVPLPRSWLYHGTLCRQAEEARTQEVCQARLSTDLIRYEDPSSQVALTNRGEGLERNFLLFVLFQSPTPIISQLIREVDACPIKERQTTVRALQARGGS